jgi:DNA ligase-1
VLATLAQFAAASDAVAATASKLAKHRLIAEYLQQLSDQDLPLALRYLAGQSLSGSGERTLNVGGAIVTDALLSLLTVDPQTYHQQIIRSGELGEALAQLWPSQPSASQPLTLESIAAALEEIASTGVIEQKTALIKDLFSRCQTPREAAYLAKIIFGDMRTGVQESTLAAAVAQAFDKPLADIRRTLLLVGSLEQVAFLARHDKLHEARFSLFHPIQFMLATAQDSPEIAAKTMAGRAFYVEDKLDGIRAQIHKSAGRVAIYTRTMDRADDSFPDLVASLEKLSGEFLLDGEIVPYCDGSILPFSHIQKRLGRKFLTPRILKENPAAFIAFDLLYLNGHLLLDKPLSLRRHLLEQLTTDYGLLTTRLSTVTTADDIAQAFTASRSRRNEGLVLKDPDSPYSPGRRGKAWLKLKSHLPSLDCVVTAAEYGHGKRRAWLSDYTFAVWDRNPSDPAAQLVNIGKSFTGLTEPEILQLTELFHSLSLEQLGHVHRVQPQVVLEIACDQIQKSARHQSGYAMRFPRIKRIRWDKLPKDADTLARVAELYASEANTAHNPKAGPVATSEPGLFDGI